MKDPILHSHIEDALPDDHPLAFKSVYCDGTDCSRMLHAFNNECMQTWVETGQGNYCLGCFMKLGGDGEPQALEDWWGLPECEHDRRIVQKYGKKTTT